MVAQQALDVDARLGHTIGAEGLLGLLGGGQQLQTGLNTQPQKPD